MDNRALPPVLVLISDGQPTDDFEAGLQSLLSQPWGKKSIRIAIAVGQDTDADILQRFIGDREIMPLQANHPDALIKYIRWVSTRVLKSVSSPGSDIASASATSGNITIPVLIDDEGSFDNVW
jgi:uncharacterized protein YegL